MRLKAPLAALAIVAVAAVAVAQPTSSRFDPATMMDSSELSRGMTGYGLSVFSGTEITRFDVEILGVLKKANLGEDLILIRVTSGPVVERESGIIGGMSGSPIYVGGRLVGAIAYGWGFLREAIGGVTPIRAMLDSAAGTEQASLPDDHPLRGAQLCGRWIDRARIDPDGPAFADERTINLAQVNPVINAAGLGDAAMQRLREMVEPYGLEAIPGPGRLSDGPEVELQPGSALGVQLLEGDFDISTVGTLTWRDGDEILAFGHPMMKMGQVRLPITTAWIHDFLPSISRSNKLSSPMRTVGALLRDGAWSVGCELGEDAPMVPARITVTSEDRNLTRTFNVRAASHEMVTPGLLMTSMLSAVEATCNPGSDGVGTLAFELEGDGGAVITREDVVYHPGSVIPVVSWVEEALYYLTQNRFSPQQPASLTARVTLSDNEKIAAIERVYVEEHVARAGEQLTVHVVMRPEGGEEFERVVRFDLPEDLPKGQLRVGAASGTEEYSLRAFLRLLMPQIDSLEDLAKLVAEMKRGNQLYVAAAIPEVALGLDGTQLVGLPVQASKLIAEDTSSDVVAGYRELSETFDTEYFLFGWQIANLPTENRLGERGKVTGRPDAEEESTTFASAMDRLPHLWWAMDSLQTDARPMQNADLPTPELEPKDEEPAPEPKIDGDDDEDEDEADEDDDTREHPEPDGEALARGLSSFLHTDADDFEEGETDGTMVRSDGAVILAPPAEMVAQIDASIAWAIAADGDACWLAVGNPGRIYRWRPGEGVETVADIGSALVLSLLPDGSGGIWAGTGPDGRVLHLSADGAIQREWQLPEDYVWSLESHAGRVLAGTGTEGRIYALEDEAQLFAQLSGRHVLDLLSAGDTLYAGVGDDQGVVFAINPEGHARSVFGCEEDAITGLALDDLGRLVVTTAEDGRVFIVDADGDATEAWKADDDALGVAFASRMAWVATASDGQIVAVDEKARTAVAAQDEVSARITAISAGADSVFAAASNPVRLWRLQPTAPAKGSYASEALDAERVSRWARVDWDAQLPGTATLEVDARSGNSRVPDDGSWSGWTRALTTPGERLQAPAARYLQYRLRMAGTCAAGPELTRIAVSYLPRNRRPTLEVKAPHAGESIRGEFELKWDAEDDDDDTLAVTISSRAAGEEEWTELKTVQGEDSWKWNTEDVEDGVYDLRLVISDEPSNPIGAATEEVIVRRVIVDNGYPQVKIMSTPRRGDDLLELRGLATDELSHLTSIDWTFGSEQRWRAAPVRDGLLDAREELFTISLPQIPVEETELKVRARDAAGNVTVETVPLLDQHPGTDEPDDAAEDPGAEQQRPTGDQTDGDEG